MRKLLQKIFRQVYKNILKTLPIKVVLNLDILRGYKKFANFKNPRYFGEKIQWLKLYGNMEQYTEYVDKYKVRDYVKKKIGEKYLIPLLAVYDNPAQILFSNLPKRFVLKINHGSGYNIIVKNKQDLNVNKTIKQLKKWLKEDYFKIKKEFQYKNIVKKIICEENIADENEELLDYKFFCFNGKTEFVKVDYGRFTKHKVNFYDVNWKLLDLREGNFENYLCTISKPKNFEKMVEIANVLAESFQFVRVDLYNRAGKIYFGELTFTPASGLNPFYPIAIDKEIAKKIVLKKKANILLISSTSMSKKRLDGVTIKCRVLEEYLRNSNELITISVDTDNYKKRFLSITFCILKNILFCDKIVICSSSPGAAKVLKFLRIINFKKDIFYFVAGGVIGDMIQKNAYDIKNYRNIKKIFVEPSELKVQLEKLGLKNVQQLNNFRYIKKFNNNYVESDIFRFVFWGRVIKEKGVEDCIKLVKKINETTKLKATLDIYGQCDEEYLSVIKKHFGKYTNYLGAITPNNKTEYEILSKYDILLFPTHYYSEGLPGTIIDSYISSLAVVASDWKYAREYVEDGENGYIFRMDDFNDFYNKTLQIMDKDLIKKFKDRSRILSQNFNVEILLKDFISDLEKGDTL